jgi:hypothetical protein
MYFILGMTPSTMAFECSGLKNVMQTTIRQGTVLILPVVCLVNLPLASTVLARLKGIAE